MPRDSRHDPNYRPRLFQRDEDWNDNEEEERITERRRGDKTQAALRESSHRQWSSRSEDISTSLGRPPSFPGHLEGVRYVQGLSESARTNDSAQEHHFQHHPRDSNRQNEVPVPRSSMPYSPGSHSAGRDPNMESRSQHRSYPSERGAWHSPTSPRHDPPTQRRHVHFTASEVDRDEYASRMGSKTKKSDSEAKSRFSRGAEGFQSLGPKCACEQGAWVKDMGFEYLQDQVEKLRWELRYLTHQKERSPRSDSSLDDFTSAFTSRVDGSNALVTEFGKIKINELLKQQEVLDTRWLYSNEDAARYDSHHREVTDPRNEEVLDLHRKVRKVLDMVADLKGRESRGRKHQNKDEGRDDARAWDDEDPCYRKTYYIIGKVPRHRREGCK